MPVWDYENSPTREDHSGESLGDTADSNDRGVPLRQYDSKRIRACPRFEGVSTPRNEWNRRLGTKTALEQQSSRTCTSKHEEGKLRHHPRGANAKKGVYVPIMHMMQGKDGP